MTYVPADNLWPTPPNLSGGRLLHDLWPTIHMFMFCSGGYHAYSAKRPPACQRQRSPRPAPLDGFGEETLDAKEMGERRTVRECCGCSGHCTPSRCDAGREGGRTVQGAADRG